MALSLPGWAAGAGVTPRTPVEHFVTLMQENHSFDNYFGTYPGADGLPPGVCMPVDLKVPRSRCVKPFRIGNRPVRDLGHSRKVFEGQFRNGHLDGFVDEMRRATGRFDPITMGHYDGRDLPYYWNIADQYVLFDRFFTSSSSGSVPNHMYWTTGTPGNFSGESIPDNGFGDIPTIFDRLERRGISWKFYVQNYDPAIDFRHPGRGDRASQIAWVPLLSYDRYIDNPKLKRHIATLDQYYEDLRQNNLPAVSYLVPSGASEHPPGSIKAGQRFVNRLINALMRSDSWDSSAFTWTYDDWGGWYDHVKPPRVDRFGYGFRAPALLVSPYAKRGYIDSTTLDFTSILKFIEENWKLRPLAARDRRARSIAGAFDFTQRPRAPRFLLPKRGGQGPVEPVREVIYVGYFGAGALTAFLLGLAALGPRGRERLARRKRRRVRR